MKGEQVPWKLHQGCSCPIFSTRLHEDQRKEAHRTREEVGWKAQGSVGAEKLKLAQKHMWEPCIENIIMSLSSSPAMAWGLG